MVYSFINQVDEGGRCFVSQYELTDLFEFDFYKTPAHSLGSYVYLLSSYREQFGNFVVFEIIVLLKCQCFKIAFL